MFKTYGQKSHHILRSVFGDLVKKNKEADECLLLCLDLTGHSSRVFLNNMANAVEKQRI